MKRYSFLPIAAVVIGLMVLTGCNRAGKEKKGTTSDGKEASVVVEVFDAVKVKDQIVEIIRNAPKPEETANLLNEAGASYIFELTMPAGDVEKMMSSTQKAIGLGMYGFDIKYASVYKRGDVVLSLKDNLNRLYAELGVQEDLTFAKKYTERIEQNKTNTDSLDFLVTQWANDFSQFMQASDHAGVYALSSIGANVEALHVLSQMTMLANDNTKLLVLMNNQNDRIKTLKSLLEIMSGDDNVKPYYAAIEPVINFFSERTTLNEADLNTVVPLIEKARGSFVQ